MAKQLECTIFNVEHGFCAFIKSPNDYGLMIDCGNRQFFSPIKWVRNHYNLNHGNIEYFEGRRIAELIISHLHADHFSDVGSFYFNKKDKPKHLFRDKESLKFIDQKIREEKDARRRKVLSQFKKFQSNYDQDITNEVNWGFDFSDVRRISYADAENISSDRDKIINNRSYIVGIEYAGKKILFPGDIEKEGWEKAFGYKSIREILAGTDFFVTSHHGHANGCHPDILRYTGNPSIYIVSAKSGDEDTHYDFYSKPENSKGCIIRGDTEVSRVISTKKRNQTIKITVNEDGSSFIEAFRIRDNLSRNQRRLVQRKTKRAVGEWGLSVGRVHG
jgi:hypothetical protein